MSENTKKDLYKILGISPSATKSEIKSAYRSLARKYHPDVNAGNKLSEIKFKEIGEAYYVLIDNEKRRQYDLLNGFTQFQNNSQAKAQARSAYNQQPKSEENKKTKENVKPKTSEEKGFNSVFSEFLDGLFKKPDFEHSAAKESKNQPPPKPEPRKGDDITADISITIAEAHNGAVRKVNVVHSETCKKCKGKKFANEAKCPECSGKGHISTHKKINVKIPPNVKEGSKIRIPSEGNVGINGGENGDLFLLIHIQKSSIFVFDKLNVLCEIPITPSEAALGGEIQIPSIEGFITMKIPPETYSGQKFKLSGEGITDINTNKKGDYIVTAKIEMPKGLSEKEIELYKELSRVRKFNPRENLIFENK